MLYHQSSQRDQHNRSCSGRHTRQARNKNWKSTCRKKWADRFVFLIHKSIMQSCTVFFYEKNIKYKIWFCFFILFYLNKTKLIVLEFCAECTTKEAVCQCRSCDNAKFCDRCFVQVLLIDKEFWFTFMFVVFLWSYFFSYLNEIYL